MPGVGRSPVLIIAAILTLLIGLALAVGGIWLISLGGSWYYVISALGFLLTGVLLFMQRPAALWIYALVTAGTLGWAFAWRSLMAAEIYVTILTGFGLGHLLHYGRELNAMDQVIGIMIVIVVIGLLVDRLLFSPWERILHRRWGTNVREA